MAYPARRRPCAAAPASAGRFARCVIRGKRRLSADVGGETRRDAGTSAFWVGLVDCGLGCGQRNRPSATRRKTDAAFMSRQPMHSSRLSAVPTLSPRASLAGLGRGKVSFNSASIFFSSSSASARLRLPSSAISRLSLIVAIRLALAS